LGFLSLGGSSTRGFLILGGSVFDDVCELNGGAGAGGRAAAYPCTKLLLVVVLGLTFPRRSKDS
jgi:hypothetical protein